MYVGLPIDDSLLFALILRLALQRATKSTSLDRLDLFLNLIPVKIAADSNYERAESSHAAMSHPLNTARAFTGHDKKIRYHFELDYNVNHFLP